MGAHIDLSYVMPVRRQHRARWRPGRAARPAQARAPEVADAIVEALQRGTVEVCVPKAAKRTYQLRRTAAALVAEGLGRAIKADRVLSDVEHGAPRVRAARRAVRAGVAAGARAGADPRARGSVALSSGRATPRSVARSAVPGPPAGSAGVLDHTRRWRAELFRHALAGLQRDDRVGVGPQEQLRAVVGFQRVLHTLAYRCTWIIR